MIIAVDATGGQYAPHEIVKGAVKAAQDYDVGIALVGRKDLLYVQTGRYLKKLDITIVTGRFFTTNQILFLSTMMAFFGL